MKNYLESKRMIRINTMLILFSIIYSKPKYRNATILWECNRLTRDPRLGIMTENPNRSSYVAMMNIIYDMSIRDLAIEMIKKEQDGVEFNTLVRLIEENLDRADIIEDSIDAYVKTLLKSIGVKDSNPCPERQNSLHITVLNFIDSFVSYWRPMKGYAFSVIRRDLKDRLFGILRDVFIEKLKYKHLTDKGEAEAKLLQLCINESEYFSKDISMTLKALKESIAYCCRPFCLDDIIHGQKSVRTFKKWYSSINNSQLCIIYPILYTRLFKIMFSTYRLNIMKKYCIEVHDTFEKKLRHFFNDDEVVKLMKFRHDISRVEKTEIIFLSYYPFRKSFVESVLVTNSSARAKSMIRNFEAVYQSIITGIFNLDRNLE